MFKLQSLKVFIKQRLTEAVDEVFTHLEETITEYEEELSRRQRLFDAEITPRRHDIQVCHSEDFPQQQHDSLDVEEPQEESTYVKEEDRWTSPGEEEVDELDEAEINKLPFTVIPVKNDEEEDDYDDKRDEDSSEETHGEDGGDPEPAGSSDPPDSLGNMSQFYEAEVEKDLSWMDLREEGDMGLNDNGGKSYICSECGKTFSQRGTLQRHLRRHTGEKPFTCSVCSKHFTQKVTLKQHMRIHTGEKPYGCSECGKRFTQLGHLKCHRTVHTGERPFSCSVCDRRFTRPARLKNHKCVDEGVWRL